MRLVQARFMNHVLTFVGTRLGFHTWECMKSKDLFGVAESIRLNREACKQLGKECLVAYEGVLYMLNGGRMPEDG